ncbi:MAG TPA: hypothetical protein VK501_20330 [Baekduia sp.]|uniref:hypothetical protein n=1 Tax=Baekduia sp. TaxID=2600305 RepID=UPI002CF464C1|nr:hypothetical protein [Baekduia sp.]HMJ36260.1 hypothetical protein [Baekduia sp.]
MFSLGALPIAASAIALAIGVSPASALTWTPPLQLPGRYIDVDATDAPPVAANTRGDVVASWIGPRGNVVAVGNRTRGFSKPVDLPALLGEPTVAIGPNGGAIVGWTSAGDDAHAFYATLSSSGRRGAAQRIDAKSVITEDTVFAAQPDGSFLVVYHATDHGGEGRTTLRALRIARNGHAGRPAIVSAVPRFDDDDYELTGASTVDGRLFVCCGRTASGRTLGWRYAPRKGWASMSFKMSAHEHRGALATSAGLTLATNTDARKAAFGVPALELLRAGSVRRVLVDVPHPTTTAVKAGTIDAHGRPLVTYADGGQLYGVSLDAQDMPGRPTPLGPVPSDPERDSGFAQPVAAAWHAGALVAWVDQDHWRVATERDGVFAAASAPSGVVASTRLATAGGAAVLSWYDHNHHAFVSIARP